MKALYINNNGTFIFEKNQYEIDNLSIDDFKKYANYTEKEIIKIISKKKPVTSENKFCKSISEHLDTSLFEKKGESLYMKGINIAIPFSLANKFVNLMSSKDYKKDPYFKSLVKFWYWCSLNPIAQSREDLFNHIDKYDIQLTPNGNMVMFRRIVSKIQNSENHEYIDFVTSNYIRIKKNKKSPKNYVLFNKYEGEYELRKNNSSISHNTLQNAYDNLKNISEWQYTDDYTRKENIKFGDVYKINEDLINLDNNIACGSGLHVASWKKKDDYASFGNTDILVLVNPSKVRSVPHVESSKLRVSEMFILCKEKEYSEDLLLNYDTGYMQKSTSELKRMIKSNKIVQSKRYSVFNVKNHNFAEIDKTILKDYIDEKYKEIE